MSSDATILVAAAAGLISFLSPCVLPLVPAYLGQLTAVAVATAGVIAFVALMVPSLIRRWVGRPHRVVTIGSALLGATLLVVADVLARSEAVGDLLLPLFDRFHQRRPDELDRKQNEKRERNRLCD